MDVGVQKSRPSWEKDAEEPHYGLVKRRLFVTSYFSEKGLHFK